METDCGEPRARKRQRTDCPTSANNGQRIPKIPWFDRTDEWNKNKQKLINHGLLTAKQIESLDDCANFLEVLNPELRDAIAVRCRICYKYRIIHHLCVMDVDKNVHKTQKIK
jgi:hypothetical protein